MPDDWIFQSAKPIVGASPAPTFGDISDLPDVFVETLEAWNNSLNKTFNDFSARVIELGGASSLPFPQTRSVRVVGLVLKGLKVVKLLVGEDEGGGFDVALEAFDYSALPDEAPPDAFRQLFFDRVKQLQLQASSAGVVIMDPVWLADPKV